MSKKIVVLNGSPRKTGNTAALIDAFTAGAEEAGNKVKRFDIQQMNIRPCLGCLKGGTGTEGPCTQNDGMNEIYPFYKEADIVVFASPLYFWSFSAQLKMAIDRLFAVTEAAGMKSSYKECVMLVAAEEDTKEAFEQLVAYYSRIVKNLRWKDRGMVLAGGVYQVGDIAGKPSLEEARKLGASIS
jgi:multimeric flavodoxin WrbA